MMSLLNYLLGGFLFFDAIRLMDFGFFIEFAADFERLFMSFFIGLKSWQMIGYLWIESYSIRPAFVLGILSDSLYDLVISFLIFMRNR